MYNEKKRQKKRLSFRNKEKVPLEQKKERERFRN